MKLTVQKGISVYLLPPSKKGFAFAYLAYSTLGVMVGRSCVFSPHKSNAIMHKQGKMKSKQGHKAFSEWHVNIYIGTLA